jgi:hypothetical protein
VRGRGRGLEKGDQIGFVPSTLEVRVASSMPIAFCKTWQKNSDESIDYATTTTIHSPPSLSKYFVLFFRQTNLNGSFTKSESSFAALVLFMVMPSPELCSDNKNSGVRSRLGLSSRQLEQRNQNCNHLSFNHLEIKR